MAQVEQIKPEVESQQEELESISFPKVQLANYRKTAERRGFKSVQDYFNSLVTNDMVDNDDLLRLKEDELDPEEEKRVREDFKETWREILTDTLETISEEEFWAALKEEDDGVDQTDL